MTTHRPGAAGLIELIADPDSFLGWDTAVDIAAWPSDYQDVLRIASRKSGTDEAVTTGQITLGGRPVAAIASEFAFLGGSIGRTAADRIVDAVRTATRRRLPILAAPASGGTRMQEGTPAFLHMMDIVRAIVAHRDAGLPVLVYLRHPTMGGTLASWASLGHVTLAEPHATIGFLGDKVYRALHGRPFPPGVQTAEHLAAHGILDAVVAPDRLRATVDRILRVLVDEPTPRPLPRRPGRPTGSTTAWENVLRTRAPDRAGLNDVLAAADPDAIRLRPHSNQDAVVVALARWAGRPCVLVGQDRFAEDGAALGVAALRHARRGIALAADLRIPLVTVIDTPGGELSPRAEENGLAREIARCVAAMVELPIPSVAVLLGQGCGGAALALFAARTVVATERAWLSPLPLEGASVLLYGDATQPARAAAAQGIRALDLVRTGAVDHVVPEEDADTPATLAHAVVAEVAHRLRENRSIGRPVGGTVAPTCIGRVDG